MPNRFWDSCQKSELDGHQTFTSPRQLIDSLESRWSLSNPDAPCSNGESEMQERIHIPFAGQDSILPVCFPFPCFLCGSSSCCPCCSLSTMLKPVLLLHLWQSSGMKNSSSGDYCKTLLSPGHLYKWCLEMELVQPTCSSSAAGPWFAIEEPLV